MTSLPTPQLPEISLGPGWDPAHPATRIYVQGHTYKLASPQFVHLPLANTVKAILNWVGPGSAIAKNIFYLLFPAGVDTTVPAFLGSVGDAVMTQMASAGIGANLPGNWQLQSCTVKDNALSTGASGTSVHAPIVGAGGGTAYPPNCAVVISWPIGASYRGGKPRWYIPGVTTAMVTTPGGSGLIPSMALAAETAAATFRTGINSAVIATFTPILGTISYQSGHAARPTPLFRPFLVPKVHERVDSQRRRLGKEASFGVVP